MWNIDIETRVRNLSAEANDRHARLLDTMTETDGSANSGRRLISRLAEGVKQAFIAPGRPPRPIASRLASMVSGK